MPDNNINDKSKKILVKLMISKLVSDYIIENFNEDPDEELKAYMLEFWNKINSISI